MIENQVKKGEAKIVFRNFTIIGEQSAAGRRRGARRRRAGPRLELPRALLPQPGRRELRLRRRRIPRSDRQGRRRQGHRQVERGPRQIHRRSRRNQRRSPRTRLHRHAVVRDQGPEDRRPRAPRHAQLDGGPGRSDRRGELAPIPGSPASGLHNHHYRAFNRSSHEGHDRSLLSVFVVSCGAAAVVGDLDPSPELLRTMAGIGASFFLAYVIEAAWLAQRFPRMFGLKIPRAANGPCGVRPCRSDARSISQ